MYESLKGLYSGYRTWVETFETSRTVRDRFTKLFNRNRDFRERREHNEFFEAVRAEAEALTEGFRSGSEEADTLYELLHFVFIDCYAQTDKVTALMYLAAEQHFVPLLELLGPDERQALYAAYKKQRRKDPGLPLQGQIQKKMKELCQERTGSL